MATQNYQGYRPRRHPTKSNRRTHGAGKRRLCFEPLEERRLLAVVTVDTDQDLVDFNDGATSLREAIFATNLVPGADEIRFNFGHDGPATIQLTQGELAITDSLTITGMELLTIDASGNDPTPDQNRGDGSRIFTIDDGNFDVLTEVAISGITLTGGDVRGDGGAILTRENLRLFNMALRENAASGSGGGLSAYNPVGGELYGAIYVDITNSSLSGNESRERTGGIINGGGGIYSSGNVILTHSMVNNNVARGEEQMSGFGGGILSGDILVTDSKHW